MTADEVALLEKLERKEHEAKLARVAAFDATLSDEEVEWEKCRRDAKYFIDTYCWTFDSSTGKKQIKFKLFDKQRHLCDWYEERWTTKTPGIVVKSRQVGVSWVFCALAVHAWLFREGIVWGFGSNKVDNVENKSSPKSLFSHVRFLIERLPKWMIPSFDMIKHGLYLNITNPSNGNVIIGEGGDNIGRGGNTSTYVVDESAFTDRPEMIDAALIANSKVIIHVSTPNGLGGPFYTKATSGAYSVFRFHWRDDPRKTQEWYDAQCLLYPKHLIASEFDLDFSASAEGVVVPSEFVQAAVKLWNDKDFRKQLQQVYSVNAGLDIGDDGSDSTVLTFRRGPIVDPLRVWKKLNTTQTAWRAVNDCSKENVEELFYDAIGVGAGVRGTVSTMIADDDADHGLPTDVFGTRRVPFTVTPIKANSAVIPVIRAGGILEADLFANLRAQLWWRMREMCERTYEYVVKGITHKPEDLIAIPNDSQLIAELSMPRWTTATNGKIRVESKKDMRKRGLRSPDRADSLCLAFTPTTKRHRLVSVFY